MDIRYIDRYLNNVSNIVMSAIIVNSVMKTVSLPDTWAFLLQGGIVIATSRCASTQHTLRSTPSSVSSHVDGATISATLSVMHPTTQRFTSSLLETPTPSLPKILPCSCHLYPLVVPLFSSLDMPTERLLVQSNLALVLPGAVMVCKTLCRLLFASRTVTRVSAPSQAQG